MPEAGLIIELREESPELAQMLREQYGVTTEPSGLRWHVRLGYGHDPDEVIRRVEGDPRVEFAERAPVLRVGVDRALSDQQQAAAVRSLWEAPAAPAFPGMTSMAPRPPAKQRPVYSVREHGNWPAQHMLRPEDWNELELDNIAILDSGCDAGHPGLEGAVDFGDSASRKDGYGHGTFIASTLVGRPLEEPELPAGVLPRSRVWVANVFQGLKLGDEWEYALDLERFSGWLRQLAERATRRLEKIEVLNLSLGSLSASRALRKDLKAVIDAGITVVAAAGNSPKGERPGPVMYPAAYPEVISVGALAYAAEGDEPWPRANRELPATKRERAWDVCAPGECILGGLPWEENALGVKRSGWMSGTSMATPYVTAAVAVLRAQGVKSREEIVARLEGTGRCDRRRGIVSLVCPPAGKAAGGK